MSHKKVDQNVYFDKRCTKFPYYVNIMRRGHQLYKKFTSKEQAVEARDKFIERHTMKATDHPYVFHINGEYVLEAVIHKTFGADFEAACIKGDILIKFSGD